MKTISLKYGDHGYNLNFADNFDFTLVQPPLPLTPQKLVIDYAADTLLKRKFEEINKPPGKVQVGICINDKTRPVPYSLLLPDLLTYLTQCGLKDHQITFFIANGTHIPEDPLSLAYIPDFVKHKYRIVNHDCDDRTNIQYLGMTSRRTPVFINRNFLACDLKIAVGNIEPHHFAGYSGGVKSAAIGLAGRQTILENHKLLVDPQSKACNFHSNPLRQDIEEIGWMTGLDFCLNSIKDREQNLIQVLWGSPTQVLQAAMPIIDRLFLTDVDQSFDIVIASAGGYPKDINLYQAQKAVTNAAKITKDGGLVLLVAECREGSGSLAYETYMKQFSSPQEVLNEYQQGKFEIGPHKALQFAFIQSRVKVALVSTMDADLVKSLLLIPVQDIEQCLNSFINGKPTLSLAVMPDAVITIPRERE